MGFTSKFTTTQYTCYGGDYVPDTGTAEIYVKSGYSCSEGGDLFKEVSCQNVGSLLLVTIPPGGSTEVRCVLDSSPFEDDAPNCVMVEWCGQKSTIDQDKTPCNEGECNCAAKNTAEMLCCTEKKMASAATRDYCSKCPQNELCAGLVVQGVETEVCSKCCNADDMDTECHIDFTQESGNPGTVRISGHRITACSQKTDDGLDIFDIASESGPNPFNAKEGTAKCVTCSDGTVPGECSAEDLLCKYTPGEQAFQNGQLATVKEEKYELVSDDLCSKLEIESVEGRTTAVLTVKDESGVKLEGEALTIKPGASLSFDAEGSSAATGATIVDRLLEVSGRPGEKDALFNPLSPVRHSFPSPGKFTARLTVEDSAGGKASDSVTIKAGWTCVERGGECSCPAGAECSSAGLINYITDCPDTCCECVQRLACSELGGKCECEDGFECQMDNKIYDSTDCKDTCCLCVDTSAALKIMVDDRPEEKASFKATVKDPITVMYDVSSNGLYDLEIDFGDPKVEKLSENSKRTASGLARVLNYPVGTYTVTLNVKFSNGLIKTDTRTFTISESLSCAERGGSCLTDGYECVSKGKMFVSDCPDTCCIEADLVPKAILKVWSDDTPLTSEDVTTSNKKINFDLGDSNQIDTSFFLEYGDGSSEEIPPGSKPSYVYPAFGAFYPRLTVKDKAGRTGEDTISLLLTAPGTCDKIPGASCERDENIYICNDEDRKRDVSDCPDTCCVWTCKQFIEFDPVIQAGKCSGDLAEADSYTYPAGEEICFDATDSKGCDLSYVWDITDPSGKNFKHELDGSLKQTFFNPGIYKAQLKIVNRQGESAMKTVSITVEPLQDYVPQKTPRLLDVWAKSDPSERGKDVIHAYMGEEVYFKANNFDSSTENIFKQFIIDISGPSSTQQDGSALSIFRDEYKKTGYIAFRVFGVPGKYSVVLFCQMEGSDVRSHTIELNVGCKNTCTGGTECLPENILGSAGREVCCRVCTPKKESAEEGLKELDLPVECESVVYQGDPAGKLDLVFIPSGGYAGKEDFEATIRAEYDSLLETPPFDKYSDRINIWEVFQPVNCNIDSQRMLFCSPSAAETKCPNDKTSNRIFLIKNVAGTSNAVIQGDVAFIDASVPLGAYFVHELGHLLGLDDEYIVASGTWQSGERDIKASINCDTTGLCKKWTDSGRDGYVAGAGCFPGCTYYNAYRSAETCMMKNFGKVLEPSFCPVCINHIDRYFTANTK